MKKPQLTRRRLETLPREALHIARNATKADVYRFEWPPDSGRFAVLKEMRARPLWYRVLAGRWFLRREHRALRALNDIEGVPRAIARPDADSLVMEWRAGTPLMEWEDGTVSPQALEKVAQIIAQSHARGVVHGDLHRSNVLLTPEGEVTLIDWATAGVFGPRRGAKNWTFEEWRALDVRAVAKLKARHAPTGLSATEKVALSSGSKLYRLVRGAGFKIRRLFGHRKATSPDETAAQYRKLMEEPSLD
ncbi:MAG: phosphotransferase [Armatimonadetes bacterium]|nr:phosphotransferase [Armatimonadota bacterium]